MHSTQIPSNEVISPTDLFDDLWERTGHPRSSSRSTKKSICELRKWNGHIAKGKQIGAGGFGDVYDVKWVNLPESTMEPPKTVVKVMRERFCSKTLMEKGLLVSLSHRFASLPR